MPVQEAIRQIVIDPTGRITAISGVKSRPLKVGDRVFFMASDKIGPSENGSGTVDSIEVHFKSLAQEVQPAFLKLMQHAMETFGSKKAAEEWISIECGALNNESPANFIHNTGNVAEVERILNCIDYGMIA